MCSASTPFPAANASLPLLVPARCCCCSKAQGCPTASRRQQRLRAAPAPVLLCSEHDFQGVLPPPTNAQACVFHTRASHARMHTHMHTHTRTHTHCAGGAADRPQRSLPEDLNLLVVEGEQDMESSAGSSGYKSDV